jgi:hypothetical protein
VEEIGTPCSGKAKMSILRTDVPLILGERRMLQAYFRGALGRARYEILGDDGGFYGEIPGFEGVYANADPLEECRDELEEVLRRSGSCSGFLRTYRFRLWMESSFRYAG